MNPSSPHGLDSGEAARLLAIHGPNELVEKKRPSAASIFVSQFRGPMTTLLFVACAIAAALGEGVDAIAIAAIAVLNGVVGFVQELRAERAMLALRALTAPRARVFRDGVAVIRPASEIVPGDVLLLEAGDRVAADATVLEAHRLTINEAALTGESVPVEKSPRPLPEETPLAERTDRVYAGTAIALGTGHAEVHATGMNTELGRIARLLEESEEGATPLQARLERVTRSLMIASAAIAVVISALAFFRGSPLGEVLLSAVSLAVAAVPEGLPAVVTIALAVGVERMAARQVLVRRLSAVETLGCATVICTDKTGTLTTGRMSVRELFGPELSVLRSAAACCDAELNSDGGSGDPTELAILEAARARGIERSAIERELPRKKTFPFDTDRRRMSILRSDGVLYVKGAVEAVLELCTSGTEGALETNRRYAARGLRVLAIAAGDGEEEARLRLIGLVGISDPPRPEAIEAIAHAHRAGVRTVMITGDHPLTARAIAEELGIAEESDGPGAVHARATAEQKLAIVRELKARGEIVGMTGDGVNDAPALREAHIGIAMGKNGTEVSREAADIILTDDNYASIVRAIEQGRGIYLNIQKALLYMLSGEAAELAVMFGAAIFGFPLPLLPAQLLWINLVTDGLPALALVMDPAPADVLDQPPRRRDEPMLGRPQWTSIALIGALEAVVALAAFAWMYQRQSVEAARNIAFSVLVYSQLFRALSFHSATRIFFAAAPLSNRVLLATVAGSVALQLGIQHLGWAQKIFDIHGITTSDTLLALAVALIPVTVVELSKLVMPSARSPFGAVRRVLPPSARGHAS